MSLEDVNIGLKVSNLNKNSKVYIKMKLMNLIFVLFVKTQQVK